VAFLNLAVAPEEEPSVLTEQVSGWASELV